MDDVDISPLRAPLISCGTSIMSVATQSADPRRILDGLPPDKRIVIRDVSWDVYERMVDSVYEGEGFRIAYDGKDIELMTVGPRHESRKSLPDMFIAIVATQLRIDRRPMGSTTWKRKLVGRGIESDLSYYFDPIKLAAYEAADARQSDNIDDYPNPDLAAEIDISPPVIDRSDIYAKLRVPEIWRVAKGLVSIEQLDPTGRYNPAARSQFLHVTPEDLTRWIFIESSCSLLAWEHFVREWAEAELPRD
jgi:Uma2 family endonuclease